MAEPILYQFVPGGHGDVVSAIRSITAAAQESARAFEGVGIGADHAASTTARAAARGAASTEREAQRAIAAANRSGQAQARASDQAAKAAERAAAKATAATTREEEKRWREVERASAKIVHEYEKEAAAAERAADKKTAAAKRAHDSFMRNPTSALGGLGNMALGAVGGLAMSAFSTGAQIVGGLARESAETQSIANRVSINARMPGQQAVDPTTLRKEFESAAMATPGQSAGDIGKATQAYVDLTGDLDTARSSMKTFATVASATGATVEDVATTAASLGSKFNIKNVADMQRVFAGLTAQGKGGAMTMKDLAAQFQKLSASAAAFDIGKGPEAVARLGGLVQIARTGTGSARDAGTSVQNVFSSLSTKGKMLHKYAPGVHIYDKAGGKRDIDQILAETISQVGGSSLEKKNEGLNKIFGARGVRTINPLIAAYTDAAAGKTGHAAQEAGYEAVLGALKKATAAASDWAEVETDAAQAQQDTSAKLEGAWEKLKAAVGDKLAPKIEEIVGKLADSGAIDLFILAIGVAADALEALAAFLVENHILKGGTGEEKAAVAQKKSDIYGKQLQAMGGADLTPAQIAKLPEADQQKYRDIYSKKLKADEVVGQGKRLADFEKSQEDIKKANPHAGEWGLEGGRGRELLDQNQKDFDQHKGRWAKTEDYGGWSTAPTPEERAAREAKMHAGNGKGGAPGADGAAATKDAAAHTVAAAKAMTGAAKAVEAAVSKGPGSITGKPQTPGAAH